MNIFQKGYGTEKLHDVLEKHFKSYNVKRFDRDEILNFKKLNQRLDSFHAGEIDILVGTQMLSKGHNFKRVNLVLIFGIDAALNFPDFRANERVYQLLTQVSGRSGRFGNKSEVLIHTLGVDNNVFKYVFDHSFDEFYKDELKVREFCQTPPFTKIIMIYFTSNFQRDAKKVGLESTNIISSLINRHFPKTEALGPRPSLIEKKVNKYTWVLMLRGNDTNQLHNLLKTYKLNYKPPYNVSISIDVDPYHFF